MRQDRGNIVFLPNLLHPSYILQKTTTQQSTEVERYAVNMIIH